MGRAPLDHLCETHFIDNKSHLKDPVALKTASQNVPWRKRGQGKGGFLLLRSARVISLLHAQPFKNVRLTLLARRLRCIDSLKDVRLLRLVNVPQRDLLCSRVIGEAQMKIHTHLIAQMP